MNGSVPRLARILGYAGLLPQAFAVMVLLKDDPATRFAALAFAFAYAALILSFLGGTWWGLATRGGERTPAWLWIAAVAPSLLALATALPWWTGQTWPGPSLLVLAGALVAALAVDRAIVAHDLAPAGWIALRLPLSLGL
ncbi:hypothetical protein ASG29_10605, partial [Sphingomonas sp. Leaf412]|uniref:DUF3429 domain-containing protein n=1 Tax=Sphingomonas sp. Leaf412 TaxID=1736370 RepID=UPI0007000FA6